MAWESRDFEGYLIKKIKQDNLQSEKVEGITNARALENANDFDSEDGSDNDNVERWVSGD